jgi:precorrin-6B methylase 2
LEGKTVLDIGAGCGETIYFYLLNGAKKVIANEIDPASVAFIEKNALLNGWNVEIINGAFDIATLSTYSYDFMKMDIEGGEKCLIEFNGDLKPCVIEVHDDETKERLMSRFGLLPVVRVAEGVYLLKK